MCRGVESGGGRVGIDPVVGGGEGLGPEEDWGGWEVDKWAQGPEVSYQRRAPLMAQGEPLPFPPNC